MGSFVYSLKSNVIYVILGILALNVLVLDYMVFFAKPKSIVQNIQLSNPTQETTILPTSNRQTQTTASNNTQPAAAAVTCPNTCMAAIKTATESLKLTQTVVNNTTAQSSPATSSPQEYFIPFGSGSGASQGTYTSLSALSAYVNTTLYTSISTVTFEVSATIPNGNQSATIQLYNATDGYVIPNSQVSISGGTPQLLISPNITLPTGNKLYQVQINTQLNSPIVIDQARLHITTN